MAHQKIRQPVRAIEQLLVGPSAVVCTQARSWAGARFNVPIQQFHSRVETSRIFQFSHAEGLDDRPEVFWRHVIPDEGIGLRPNRVRLVGGSLRRTKFGFRQCPCPRSRPQGREQAADYFAPDTSSSLQTRYLTPKVSDFTL